jgi:DNA-binding CsgD family transcriptional regulator
MSAGRLDVDTIERIYTGALAKQPWRELVEMLCDRFDAIILALAFRTTREDMPSVGVHAFRGNGQAVWDSFFKGYRDIATFPYSSMETGLIHRLSDFVRDPSSDIARMRRDLHDPLSVGEVYAMALTDRGSQVAFLIWVKAAGRSISPDEAALAESVAIPLARAVGGYHRTRLAELSSRLAADALGRLEVGVLAIDEQARVLFSNAVAQQLVAECSEIGIHDGRLVMAGHALAAKLEASRIGPQAAQIHASGDAAVGVMMVPVSDGRDELGPESRPERAIYMHHVSRSAPITERLIAELFGLSPTEARLAALLCSGSTLREAAMRMQVAENSVRTYSKTIFSKLGVSRQAELVRHILTSVAIFGNVHRA